MATHDFHFHIWELDPATGKPRKWCGQVSDPKHAFAWMDKQPRGREGYKVNNISPTPPKDRTPIKKAQPVKKAAPLSPVYHGENQRVRAERQVAPVAKKSTPPPKETAEQKRMKADAQGLLKQHKSDEDQDLKAGINR